MSNIWKLIINPVAGGTGTIKSGDSIPEILSHAGIDFNLSYSEYHKHIIHLVAESISLGYRNFIIVGGDGSLNQAVNGIYSQSLVNPSEITIAHISLGTGNDWQRTHHLNISTQMMIKKIQDGNTSLQDVGVITYLNLQNQTETSYFINIAGLGFDAFVVNNTSGKNQKTKSSKFSYLISLLRSLIKYKPSNAIIKLNGIEFFNGSLFSCSAGIGKYNGGGMMQLPDAIPDDGLLDITVFRSMSLFKIVSSIGKLYSGSFKKMKQASLSRASQIEITSTPGILLECDGEMLGQSPVKITIIPLGFRFIS